MKRVKILWLSNIDLPDSSDALKLKKVPFGGWIFNMTKRLAENTKFEVGIAMRSETNTFREFKVNNIRYFALPKSSNIYDVRQKDVDSVLNIFKPQIIHIEGCEMQFTKRFIDYKGCKKLFSMQGVLHGYAPYELGRLSIRDIILNSYYRSLIIYFILYINYVVRFLPRLKYERYVMSRSKYITGRTFWDKSQASVLSPNAKYFHCSRILRDGFNASKKWDIHSMEKHSLFIGNSVSPRKGAHVVLKAVHILKEKFPNIKLYISGQNPNATEISLIKKLFGYQSLLLSMIKKLSLEKNIIFTGVMHEDEMRKRFLKSHAYIMSSLIENSPNTLGESMLLGIPTISAYSGGSPSMAKDNHEALFYRPDDPLMLAAQIEKIFNSESLAQKLSKNSIARARENHDATKNLNKLISIYEEVLGNE